MTYDNNKKGNMREITLWVVGWIVAVVVIVALCVGGYNLYWQIQKQDSANQNDVNHNSQQYQDSLTQREQDRYLDWTHTTDAGQKQAIADQFCQDYADIREPSGDLVAAHAKVCG